jgi:SPX domain protein involved in polyphosphate accumulation
MELSRIFGDTLPLDSHCNEQKEYWIRSIYFDTPESDDYYEKISGIYRRKKIRLRVYSDTQEDAKLEIKNRIRDFIYKEGTTISRTDALQLLAGNKEVLLNSHHPTLNNAYFYMARDLYRPVVTVDYEREAYIGPRNDIRITFDKNIRGSSMDFDIYNKDITMIPAFDEETVVMEVKYKEFLPEWIRDILKYRSGERFAISKYYFTRIIHFR